MDMAIPEKRPWYEVEHAVHRAILTGDPVELRDDEVAELRRDPLNQNFKALAEAIHRADMDRGTRP